MASSSPPSVLIIGSGAMASLFAGRLAAVSAPVTLLGSWAAGVQAVRQSGVRLVDEDGREALVAVRATSDPQECRGAHFALVLRKAWQTPATASLLAQCLAPEGMVLTLQSGIGNREQLIRTLGVRRVALGITTLSATLLAPGVVQQAGEPVITLNAPPGLAPLVGWLRQAGFVIENAPDANALLWGKLVISAATDPLTALLGALNGELLTRPSARLLLQAAAREAAAVAVAQGIALPYPDPVVATEALTRRTATGRSPMLQDVLRGGPTEIEAINGAIVRAGEQVNLPTPINRTLWQLVSALQERPPA